jgi:MFS superfamily sulfate permease-like transporter
VRLGTRANAVHAGHEPGTDGYEGRSPFRPARQEPLLRRAIPVAAMAYAEVAGVSPVNGLYALLLPAVAYALLGSSKQLSIGPEGSIATLLATAILPLAVAGSADAAQLAAMLAILVAICFAAGWALRLGWIAHYFSRPVLIGYIHGVAVVLEGAAREPC